MTMQTNPTSILAAFAAGVAIVLSIDAVPATAAPRSPAAADATPPAATNSVTATEGAQFSGQVAVLAANCSRPQNPQATITWAGGGPRSAAEVTESGSQLHFSGSNTYGEEGSFSGTVTGSYTCPSPLAVPQISFTANFAVTVADAPISVSSRLDLPASVPAGHSFTAQIAGFTDADPAGSAGDYTAVISWGDGTTSRAAIAPAATGFALTATHTYATPGAYTTEVRIYDHGGASASAQAVVQVPPGPARLRAHVVPDVGDGTAVLSLDPTRPGTLTISPIRRHHRLLVAGRTIRVGKPGPLAVVLKPTPFARGLLALGRRLGGEEKLRYAPFTGPSINTFIKVNFTDKYCDGSVIYDYTGVEQSCIVPTGVQAVKVIAVGGRGGNVSEPCGQGANCAYGNFGGDGGLGALVVDPELPVHSGETLYIEVGGNGGDTYASESPVYGYTTGSAGAGGWNGGGAGQYPFSRLGSGGGGGASDVQTLSCAQVCDQAFGFGTFIALASRLVIAGGGGGGGSGGYTGLWADNQATQGGNGGNAAWQGDPGSEANVSWAGADLGTGGDYGFENYGGAGGGPANYTYCENGDTNDGSDGMIGAGGAGGNDTDYAYADGRFALGYAGGGGGGGWAGGGGGGGGCIAVDSGTAQSGGGGGGGGGSSIGPPGTSAEVNPGEQPHIQIMPVS